MVDVAELDDADDPELPEGQQVEIGTFGQIDLHVKDLELAKVLQLLSIQSRRNIVASRNVGGNISADLYDVGFYEALDAILHTNGFGYREQGNFIYVYTQQELAEMDQANREMATRVMRLNYITARDAAEFVRPMLSSGGAISVPGDVPAGMQPSITDAGANSYAHDEMLVVRDFPENIDEILEVVVELDVRPKQVQIEATILTAQLTEANAFGVDFALFSRLGVDDFALPFSSLNDIIEGTVQGRGAATSTPTAMPDGRDATLKVGFLGGDAAVFVRALDSVTDTTIVARPQMLVLNRQRAELLVGRQEGYLSTTTTDVTATQTVEFVDIGTQLTVRPFVSEDGFVRLELMPKISSGGVEDRGGTLVPSTDTQELTTNVMVRSGQTVVLGGLFKERTDTGRNQVPGIGDIPLFGIPFRGRNDAVQRDEVIFLIKPTIIRDETLFAAGDRAHDTVELARVGAREGLLPWSRTRLSHAHLRKAYEYHREGDDDRALWHLDMVLHIHPTMIEALRLKERITGESLMLHDYSVFEDAINTAVDEHAPDELSAETDDEFFGEQADLDQLQPMEPAESAETAEPAEDASAGDGSGQDEVEASAATEEPADPSTDASGMDGDEASDDESFVQPASDTQGASDADEPEDMQAPAYDQSDLDAAMEAAMHSIIEDEAGDAPAGDASDGDESAETANDADADADEPADADDQ